MSDAGASVGSVAGVGWAADGTLDGIGERMLGGCLADAWRMLGGCSSKPKDQKREMPRPNKLQVAPEAWNFRLAVIYNKQKASHQLTPFKATYKQLSKPIDHYLTRRPRLTHVSFQSAAVDQQSSHNETSSAQLSPPTDHLITNPIDMNWPMTIMQPTQPETHYQ